MPKERVVTLRPFALTLFLFGLLAWLYVIAIQITHPEWLPLTLTHIDIPPLNARVDDVGIVAFAVSAFGFFMWQLEEASLNR